MGSFVPTRLKAHVGSTLGSRGEESLDWHRCNLHEAWWSVMEFRR